MTAHATKNLVAQNDVSDMIIPEEWNGAVAIWASGTGTVILEFGSPRMVNNAFVDEWIQIKMKDPSTAVNAEVDSLIVAASQKYAWAECVGVNRIRARKTDAGGADCFVTLMYRRT